MTLEAGAVLAEFGADPEALAAEIVRLRARLATAGMSPRPIGFQLPDRPHGDGRRSRRLRLVHPRVL